MKILQINKLYPPWVGGIEKIVQQIAEGLNNKNGIKMEVLCCSPRREPRVLLWGQPKDKSKEEIINSVKIYRASSFGMFWGMPISFKFLRLFKKLSSEADIIDLHQPFPLGNLAIMIFKPKAKLIIHYHSDIVRQKLLNFILSPLVFYTLKKAEVIIISNQNLLGSSDILKKFRSKCKIIPFGVNLNNFKPSENEKIDTIKGKYGDFVLFVGRFNYYKGLSCLISAMANISSNLVVIGEGPLRKRIESQSKKLGVLNKIYFAPFQAEKDLISYYQSCELLILPSIFKSETFGLVLIEAMACGKPVISTELGTGTSYVNQDGVTGFIVPPRDSKALAEAINKIATNEGLRREMGRNAQKRALEEFSQDEMLNKTLIAYNKIYGRKIKRKNAKI